MEKQPGSFTIDQWCEHRRVSRSGWYNLKRASKAPRTYRSVAGGREYITREADLEWVRQREAAEAEESAAFRERRAKAGTGTTGRQNREAKTTPRPEEMPRSPAVRAQRQNASRS